jgi:hypothetical protein
LQNDNVYQDSVSTAVRKQGNSYTHVTANKYPPLTTAAAKSNTAETTKGIQIKDELQKNPKGILRGNNPQMSRN